jgi:hypothetical protein
MKNLLFIIMAVLILSDCSDQFLETENKNSLDTGSFFTTENDLLLAVNAAYTPLEHGGLFGLNYFYIFNSLDPYIWFEGMAGYDIMNFGPADNYIGRQYSDLYFGLFRTSDILAKMYKVKGVVAPDKYHQYKAQLKALRGMYYFYLVTWFDQPIYYDETNVPTNPLVGYSNGTQEQFWTKLEEDLTYAADSLPVSWATTETGRITKGAANAQLGKALLYKHYHYYLRFGKGETTEAKANLLKAKDALKRVMDGGAYHLIMPQAKTKADYQGALLCNFAFIDISVGSKSYISENNTESVWEVQYNGDPGTNPSLPGWMSGGNQLYQYFSPNTGSYKNQVIDPSLWNEFESVSGHPGGYSKDPRAYATCYLQGDTMDWRPASGYNTGFESLVNAKGNLYTGIYAGFTLSKSIGLKKYYYPQLPNSSLGCSPNNVRVIRYADVLLMYAEACYQYDGDGDGTGLAALNLVRARVDMSTISGLTPAAIIHERNVELATEGHHYNDIIRWSFDPNFGINFTTLFNNKFDVNKNLYFPIPQSEIDANKGVLKQNTGW